MTRARLASAAIFASLLTVPAAAEPRLFVVDGYNATLSFSCDILGMVPVEGTFTRFLALVALDEGAPGEARAVVRVDAASMEVDGDDLVSDLKGPDFFDVAQFPEFGFASYGAKVLEPGRVRIDGKLTLRGVTRPMSLFVRYVIDDAKGVAEAKIEAIGELDRTEYGMTAYEALVSDDVQIEVDGTMKQGFGMVGAPGG